jgi:hypothetical protein
VAGSELQGAQAPAAPASPQPSAVAVPPELQTKLRAVFEPLRKAVAASIKAESASLKAVMGSNTQAMQRASAKLSEASDVLSRQKGEMLPKAKATGATDEQIQAEWSRWMSEINVGKK